MTKDELDDIFLTAQHMTDGLGRGALSLNTRVHGVIVTVAIAKGGDSPRVIKITLNAKARDEGLKLGE